MFNLYTKYRYSKKGMGCCSRMILKFKWYMLYLSLCKNSYHFRDTIKSACMVSKKCEKAPAVGQGTAKLATWRLEKNATVVNATVNNGFTAYKG